MNADPKRTGKPIIAPIPFRITPNNIVAWKGESGVRARGVLVDGDGLYFPNGRPMPTEYIAAKGITVSVGGERLDRQWTRAEKSERQKFTEQTRALRRQSPRLKAMLGAA
jgi:hypothetical protein